MDRGFSGGMFDFNSDGKMDAFERAAEYQFLNDVVFADDDTSEDEDSDSDDLSRSTRPSASRNPSVSSAAGISMGGKVIYDATKDSNSGSIFKSLLVIGLCIAGIAIPVSVGMEGFALALFPLGAVGLSILILKNT